jgi:hypothetical protein
VVRCRLFWAERLKQYDLSHQTPARAGMRLAKLFVLVGMALLQSLPGIRTVRTDDPCRRIFIGHPLIQRPLPAARVSGCSVGLFAVDDASIGSHLRNLVRSTAHFVARGRADWSHDARRNHVRAGFAA